MGSKFTLAANYLAALAIVIALGTVPLALIFLIWGAPAYEVAVTSGKVLVSCVITVSYVHALGKIGLTGG